MSKTWKKAIVLTMVMAAAAAAQESPGVLTRGERRCEAAMAGAVAGYATAVGECVTACYGAPGDPYPCSDLYAPPVTVAQCLDEARARAEIAVASSCSGADCLECYGGGCRSFRDTELSDAQTFTTIALGVLYCDDRGSVDGLTPRESKCRKTIASAGGRFVATYGRCIGRCHAEARRRGTPETACDVALVDQPGFDPATQRCVERVRRKFAKACEERCDDAPDCFPYSCESVAPLIELEVRGFAPPVYCAEQPRCGDGYVTAGEECDWGTWESACGAGYCNSQCQCESICGDGVVSDGEVCDVYGGCGPGLVCQGCTSCVQPPDRCADAVTIPAEGGTVTGTTSGLSTLASFCGGEYAPEAVFAWTPAASGTASISTCAGTTFDTVLSVRTGACGALGGEVACNDDACSIGSSVELDVIAGETYWIAVDGWSSSSGDFALTVIPPGGSPGGAFLAD